MILSLNNVGKRYNFEWIFRNFSAQLESGKRYAVLGPNGSGKSTLLQIIAGNLAHTEGEITFRDTTEVLNAADCYRYLSLSAPYLELVEEFTLKESLAFHQKFKPFIKGFSLEEIAETVHLGTAFKKQIRYYSSGMKQRAKLAQAFFSDTPILLLDEPCTNLDKAGVRLYRSLLEQYTKDKLVMISSNSPMEYEGSHELIQITDFK